MTTGLGPLGVSPLGTVLTETAAGDTTVDCTLASEIEAGLASTVDVSIECSLATEIETGLAVSITTGYTVDCTLATESETGLSSTILKSSDVTCTLSTETEVGLAATITQNVISITNTVSRVWKLTTATTGDISISLSWTGSPAGIEAQFNGGAWQTIIASPVGTSGSGTLTNQAYGQGQLNVRFTDDTGVSTSALKVGVGLIFATFGQSNNVGHNTQYNLYPTHATLVAQEWSVAGAWIDLQDSAATPYSTITAGVQCSAMNNSVANGEGSYIGGLATQIMATGMPVAFVPCAMGSTSVANWQPGASHTNPATYYGSLITRINSVGGVNAALWWQGESDAQNDTPKATYISQLDNIVTNVWDDAGCPTVIYVINSQAGWLAQPSKAYPIQEAQRYVAATNAHAIPGPDMDGAWTTGGVHYTTTAGAQTVANRAFNVISAQFLGGTVVTSSLASEIEAGIPVGINNTVINALLATEVEAGLPAGILLSSLVEVSLATEYEVGLRILGSGGSWQILARRRRR